MKFQERDITNTIDTGQQVATKRMVSKMQHCGSAFAADQNGALLGQAREGSQIGAAQACLQSEHDSHH